ncbi:MAG: WYL domain-containing protein [Thermodesulfovibrio sp.]|nr:WYL domain-containing protein [Thermodesulfovibrio sp.]
MPLEKKISTIEKALKEGKVIEIVYLKSNDVKTKRRIIPIYIGNMEYANKTFLGLQAFCQLRKEVRHFNVEKILDIRVIE